MTFGYEASEKPARPGPRCVCELNIEQQLRFCQAFVSHMCVICTSRDFLMCLPRFVSLDEPVRALTAPKRPACRVITKPTEREVGRGPRRECADTSNRVDRQPVRDTAT